MLRSALARGLNQLLLRVVRGPSEAPFLGRTAMSLWPWALRWLGEAWGPRDGVVTLQGTGEWPPGQALWGRQAMGAALHTPLGGCCPCQALRVTLSGGMCSEARSPHLGLQ